MTDPLADLRPDNPNAGWWVFHHGGLFDSVWAETPPLAHAVNIGRGSATACGRDRFVSEPVYPPDAVRATPGGSWGPSLDRLGGLQPRQGEPPIAPCSACLAALEEG